MKTIPLTKGYSCTVDDELFDHLAKRKWCVAICNGRPYAITVIGGHNVSMHRHIMRAGKGEVVDHRNRDSLDNRRCNLRFCTQAQNLQNRRKISNCSSCFKGVYWNREKKKWSACLGGGGKTKHLGHFLSEVDAAKAYNRAASALYGDFARLNEL